MDRMVALIDKQQVKKRKLYSHADEPKGLPGVLADRSRSIADQRWLVRREPHSGQLSKPKPAVRALVHDPSPQSAEIALRRRKPGTRVATAPLLWVIITMIAMAGAASILFKAKPLSVSVPNGGLTLPTDTQISGILSSYTESSAKATQNLPVRIPNPVILERLKTSSYTMKKGDTLSAIANRERVSIGTLISFNGITDVHRLTPGTVLKIPSMNGTLYRVKKGDTLEGIAKSEGVKLSNILDANSIKSSVIVPGQELFLPGARMSSFAYRKALGTLFVWPTVGVITSPFGMRHDPFTGTLEFHNGIDIANVMGTPVKAAMDGHVAMVGRNRGYGNFIILNNGNRFQTLYGHLMKSLVHNGQYVRAGQQIALMGDTGYATGPHLHFTIYKDSTPVNPLQYLPKR